MYGHLVCLCQMQWYVTDEKKQISIVCLSNLIDVAPCTYSGTCPAVYRYFSSAFSDNLSLAVVCSVLQCIIDTFKTRQSGDVETIYQSALGRVHKFPLISSISLKTQKCAIEVTIRYPKNFILTDTTVAPENTTHSKSVLRWWLVDIQSVAAITQSNITWYHIYTQNTLHLNGRAMGVFCKYLEKIKPVVTSQHCIIMIFVSNSVCLCNFGMSPLRYRWRHYATMLVPCHIIKPLQLIWR